MFKVACIGDFMGQLVKYDMKTESCSRDGPVKPKPVKPKPVAPKPKQRPQPKNRDKTRYLV
ncbi:uncharacterized protein N7529_001656 [Penicillium soppii]|jgi:hypothetical protein|uniref:uncharacterized protein n=1 Tax=Penicillium soppii TaxID=69789 RepID=UPI0025484080|nr:uncharacterized protein N7529_001656 [Penicillium soppii]KAJ5876072.1 hypothetical protein N7529_001656 [Penicillium soppii]